MADREVLVIHTGDDHIRVVIGTAKDCDDAQEAWGGHYRTTMWREKITRDVIDVYPRSVRANKTKLSGKGYHPRAMKTVAGVTPS